MTQVSLNNETIVVNTDLDSVTIIDYIEGIPGGRSLDVTGFEPPVIQAGHVVIKETDTKVFKPMPVKADGSEYDSLPSGHTIEGVVVASVTRNDPRVGIMVRGSVNQVSSPYPVTAAIKTALPLIRFTQD